MSIETSMTANTFSAGKEVMRITSRGITVAPDVHVEEAAKVVIEALEKHILNLVAATRKEALEEAADAVGEIGDHADVGAYINAIRALKEKPHD